jgi:hypothetical protein
MLNIGLIVGSPRQIFDGLGRRLTRFGTERSAELAGTEICDLGKLLDRKRSVQVALRIGERALNAIGSRLDRSKAHIT